MKLKSFNFIFAILFLAACIQILHAEPEQFKMWTRQMGTNYDEQGNALAADTSGNIYVIGNTGSNFNGNTSSGSVDIFLIKYDMSGSTQWVKQIGTTSDDYGYGIAVDTSANIYITGCTSGWLDGNTNPDAYSDIFLSKYNPAGTRLWTKQTGGINSQCGFAVTADKSGNIYVAGSANFSLDGSTGAGKNDICLIKYDINGSTQWAKLLGSPEDDYGYGVAVDTGGYIYVTGSTKGNLLNNTTYSAGGSDFSLAKYDTNGSTVWIKQTGTTSDEEARSVIIDKYGNIFITGYTNGNLASLPDVTDRDLFLIKYDSNGNTVFTNQLVNTGSDTGYSLAIDNNDYIYITGTTSGGIYGNINYGLYDIFLMKINLNGNIQWTKQYGTDKNEYAYSAVSDSSGNVFITGVTAGGIDGNTNASNQYDGYKNDFFISRYSYDTFPPETITTLSAVSTTPGTVTLSWTSPGDNLGYTTTFDAKYRIQYSSNIPVTWSVDNYNTELNNRITKNQSSSIDILNLTAGVSYYFSIWTIDTSSNISALSNITTCWILTDPTDPAGKPTGIVWDSAIDSFGKKYTNSSSLTLKWKNGNINDPESSITGFNIWFSTQPFSNSIADIQYNLYTVNASTEYNYTLTGSSEGITYYASVRAKNSVGLYSAWSDTVSITIDLVPPQAPSVICETHPLQNKEYANSAPEFTVTGPVDTSGISGYYSLLDQISTSVPTAAGMASTSDSSSGSAKIIYTKNDGIWYFHVVAKDGAGNIGTAAHYTINIHAYINPSSSNTFETSSTTVSMPADTIKIGTKLIINIPAAAAVPLIPEGMNMKPTGIYREIYLEDGTKSLDKLITITIYYTDPEITGMDETKLRLFRYDTDNSAWQLLNSEVYPSENKITGRTNHLSIFRVVEFTSATILLENLGSFPNPFCPLLNEPANIIYNLQEDTDVKLEIFDILGGNVWTKTILSGTAGARFGINTVQWTGINDFNAQVEAGAYILKVTVKSTSYKWKILVK